MPFSEALYLYATVFLGPPSNVRPPFRQQAKQARPQLKAQKFKRINNGLCSIILTNIYIHLFARGKALVVP